MKTLMAVVFSVQMSTKGMWANYYMSGMAAYPNMSRKRHIYHKKRIWHRPLPPNLSMPHFSHSSGTSCRLLGSNTVYL